MPHSYVAYGLSVQSDLCLAGAEKVSERSATGLADITIRQGTADSDLLSAKAGATSGPYRYDSGKLLFTAPGVANYIIDKAGTAILVESLPGARTEDVESLLVATALPSALWMRGEVVLHAAGCVPPHSSSAIALAGASGSGKSTLLQQLVEGGASALGDDTLCLRRNTNGVVECSGLSGVIEKRVDSQETRSSFAVPAAQRLRRAPLGTLIVLDAASSARREAATENTHTDESLPLRLRGAQALAAIVSNLHRPRVPRLLGATARLLPLLAEAAESLRVYSWKPSFTMQAKELEALSARLNAGEFD